MRKKKERKKYITWRSFREALFDLIVVIVTIRRHRGRGTRGPTVNDELVKKKKKYENEQKTYL